MMQGCKFILHGKVISTTFLNANVGYYFVQVGSIEM